MAMTKEELFVNIFKLSVLGQPLQTGDIDMQRLWDFAGFHSVRALTAHNLLQTKYDMSDEWTEKWKEEKYKNIRKSLFYKTERNKICQKLDDAGIWHIPVKGILLDDVYPKFGIREFSDNDIWVDPNCFEKLERIMENMGYKRFSSSSDVHYSFHKEPFYNFEFHYRLFSDNKEFDRFNGYFENVCSEIIQPESRRYSYKMSTEDNYIYILAHAYKHYNESGFGLRTIADTWLYRTKKSPDRQQVGERLKYLRIADFSGTLEEIGKKLFEKKNTFLFADLSDREFEMMDNIINSGKLGNREMYYKRSYQKFVKSHGKDSLTKYWIGRLFPDMEPYKNKYPLLYRHKAFRPLFYFIRPINSLVKNSSGLKKEIEVVKKQHYKQKKNNTDIQNKPESEEEKSYEQESQ